MVQDNPPLNRAARRAQARKRQPTLVHPNQAQKPPHDQDTGTGSPSEEEAEQADLPPAAFAFPGVGDTAPKGRGRPKGASKQDTMYKTLVSYYALAGLGVGRFDQADGEILMRASGDCANAWIAAGKADPRIQHALEIITVAGPYTQLIWVHASIAIMIMDRHKVNPFSALMARPNQPQAAPQAEAAPLPYTPVGPQAPTDTPLPPTYAPDTELGIPDEGLPADIDVALREMARRTGRNYDELRQEALVELAQMRLAQNGRTVAPGALGAPVMKE